MAEDLLGPLRDGPLPPLAPAAAIRARGEQRRRRGRAAMAGAVAVAVAVAGATGAAVAGLGNDDELRPTPFASQAPAPADPAWDALLDPKDVQVVAGGQWADLRGGESPFSAQLGGCPETPASAEHSAARFLTDGRAVLGQDVTLHPDDASADDGFRQLLSMLRGCGEGSDPAYREVDEAGQPATRAVGEIVTATGPTRQFSVERVGRAVVTLVLQDASAHIISALADAAADEVRGVLGEQEPTVAPSPSEAVRAWWLPDAFLSPETAAQAEQAGWTVDTSHTPDIVSPAADPCGEGRIPLDDRVRDQGERTMGSKREAGGSSLLQEVYRYDSTASAAAAFTEYEEQYVRCVSAPNPNADGPGWTTRSEVRQQQMTPTGGAMLVRSIPCAPEGGCTEHFATYTMLVREAEALTVLTYLIGEDGDPAQEAAALLVAVQQRLRQVVAG